MKTNKSLPFSKHTPWLAPLAGWSDLPFRLLCRSYGAAVCCTEMVSAKGLLYANTKTNDLLATTAEDTPLVVQLFDSESSSMQEAIHLLKEQGYMWFDCNMGCSVPKVTRSGAGAGMLKNINNALDVAASMIHAAGKLHVGFKIRLGWTENTQTWSILAKELEALGAGWISLHPRTAAQGYTGTACWEKIKELKTLVSIPVIASGDLFSATDGLNCIQETGADTVMYARGALRNPSVFQSHINLTEGILPQLPTKETTLTCILHHVALVQKHSSPNKALLKMRTIIPRYVHHLNGSKKLRLDIIQCKNWEDFTYSLYNFFGEQAVLQQEELITLSR